MLSLTRAFASLNPKPQSPESAALVFAERDWYAFRGHLLQPDGLEYVAYLLLGARERRGQAEFLVHRVLTVPASAMAQQGRAIAEPCSETLLDVYGGYANSRAAAIMHAHSHPFCERAAFSGVDDACLPPTRHDIFRYVQRRPNPRPNCFGRIVLGQGEHGFMGDVWGEGELPTHTIDAIRIVGASGIRTVHRAAPAPAPLDAGPRARLDRNLTWLGEAGQAALRELRVAVCGVGGLGTEAARNLRGLGVCDFTLVDPDRLEESNLNRLPWSRRDVGRLKVDLVREFLESAGRDIAVRTLAEEVEHPSVQQALIDADIIVAAVDDDAARLHLQRLAARHLIPLLDLGAGIDLERGTRRVAAMGGQASFYVPGGPCLLCMSLDPNTIVPKEIRAVQRATGYVRGTDETPASVVTINAIIGGIAADRLMRFATGFGKVPSWTDCNLIDGRMRSLDFAPRPDCPVCGPQGIEGLAEPPEQALRPHPGARRTFEARPAAAAETDETAAPTACAADAAAEMDAPTGPATTTDAPIGAQVDAAAPTPPEMNAVVCRLLHTGTNDDADTGLHGPGGNGRGVAADPLTAPEDTAGFDMRA